MKMLPHTHAMSSVLINECIFSSYLMEWIVSFISYVMLINILFDFYNYFLQIMAMVQRGEKPSNIRVNILIWINLIAC
jgi:hypothetical protein